MRKVDDGKKKKKKKEKKKRMAFFMATTSLPAVYRPNGYARTMTAGTPHARANILDGAFVCRFLFKKLLSAVQTYKIYSLLN